MPDVLIYGDTDRFPVLRHELGLAILDPFLYAEVGGRTYVEASPIEADRLAAARPDAELLSSTDLGFHELLESGMLRPEVELELATRAVKHTGVTEALVPAEFPLLLADRLRADGITLTPDHQHFAARRRAKSPVELAGIRLAQEAAEAGMAAAAELLRAAAVEGDRLVLDGEPLTADAVRAALREACAGAGAPAPPDIIVASVLQGFGHEPGSGPLPANLPIQIDLWPQDEAPRCWAAMTRTVVVGEVDEATRAQEALVRDAIERARAAARPGVTGRELHALACEVFEDAGFRTQRTGPGEDPTEGFQFSLGHGVGLEVHEDPSLGQAGRDPLVASDVIALEPRLWARDIRGARLEVLRLITDGGAATRTRPPYAPTPYGGGGAAAR